MFGLDGQGLGLKIAIELLIETKKKEWQKRNVDFNFRWLLIARVTLPKEHRKHSYYLSDSDSERWTFIYIIIYYTGGSDVHIFYHLGSGEFRKK